ncbi:hypothetical protein B296_00018017 [Ensete ventricosum]|uniref:Uncharacterized protein n=1 Tax=Ensete ventricosum TaxID=4639 RepID=A0A427A8J5_ENSVE|nr:hypothetical protein B296_00018017 [Ensete ventricosum]
MEMVGASTLPRNHGSVWGANNVRLEIPSAREKKPQSCRNDSLAFSEKDQPISSPSFPCCNGDSASSARRLVSAVMNHFCGYFALLLEVVGFSLQGKAKEGKDGLGFLM